MADRGEPDPQADPAPNCHNTVTCSYEAVTRPIHSLFFILTSVNPSASTLNFDKKDAALSSNLRRP